MQIVQLQGDASVSALVQRVYGLTPGAAAATATQNALLAANPHLSTIVALPVGTPVVLPTVTAGGAAPTATVSADTRRAAVLTAVQSGGRRSIAQRHQYPAGHHAAGGHHHPAGGPCGVRKAAQRLRRLRRP